MDDTRKYKVFTVRFFELEDKLNYQIKHEGYKLAQIVPLPGSCIGEIIVVLVKE